MSFSQPVRQAEVEPGRANRKVALARPAKARDCRVLVPISSKLRTRNISPKPGISLSSSGPSASGVESRPVKPVPPVTRMPCTASSAIQRDTSARSAYLSSRTMARSCRRWPAAASASHR